MKFEDEGYIINLRKHGEKSLILTVLTRNHGKITGYVKNCLTKKNLSTFQLGNLVLINAYSRLEGNMLSIRVELISPFATFFMQSEEKLLVLSSFCSLCNACIPEQENLEELYGFIDNFFMKVNQDNWLTYYCYFEFYLLVFLGVSLDLEKCCVTGSYDNLRYVSPKTGKAVCVEVGAPYHDKLYAYPSFILNNNLYPSKVEINDLLKLTEFFLNKNFFRTHYLKFPHSRANLQGNLNLD